jgi:hypothetical protein
MKKPAEIKTITNTKKLTLMTASFRPAGWFVLRDEEHVINELLN